MSVPTPLTTAERVLAGEPTLEQRLRFIDLSMECAAEAHRRMPTQGRRFSGDHATRNPEREALIRELRIEAMEREGLPLSLLGDGKTAHERHMKGMAKTHGEGWNRASLQSCSDGGTGKMHPLKDLAA